MDLACKAHDRWGPRPLILRGHSIEVRPAVAKPRGQCAEAEKDAASPMHVEAIDLLDSSSETGKAACSCADPTQVHVQAAAGLDGVRHDHGAMDTPLPIAPTPRKSTFARRERGSGA